MPIEMRDFSSGWIPSDDAYNGRKNGMLQMDNLCLDENGALTLVRGTKNVSAALPSSPTDLYSRYIGSTFYRYAALSNGNILRDTDKAGTYGTTVVTGIAPEARADFASALNQVFMVSGNKYIKDSGMAQSNIGVSDPTAPSAAFFNVPSQIDLQNLDGSSQFTNWTCDQGVLTYNNMNSDMRFQTDATSFQAVIRTVFASALDLTNYPSGGGWAIAGAQLPTDVIQFYVSIPDATQIQSITINLLSFDPGATPSTAAPSGSYYSHTWNYTDSPAPFSSNLWNLLSCQIQDFTQNGDTSQSFWNAIKASTVTFICASQINLGFTEINEQGSTRAALNGDYIYYTQNIIDNGSYEAVSKISTESPSIHVENGAAQITLTPPIDPLITSVNIYRIETGSQALPTLLINVIPTLTGYLDGLPDVTLLAGSAIQANFFFQSIQTITDPILAIVGLYYGRMLYFTSSSLIFSDYLDPDIFDNRYVLKYSGNVAEIFLWAKKVSNALIYVGTNYDVYQISGTLSVLPDGTLDATIKPLSVQYPPVSQAVAVESGTVLYMANDGWRALGSYGDDSQNLSLNLNLLFKGYSRYNTPATVPGFDNTTITRCAINKGKFYSIVTLIGGAQRLFVFDVTGKYWYTILQSPTCLFTEEDGTLVIADISGVRELDTPNNYIIDGVGPQQVKILTPIFDGGTPRQRKDTYTLKLSFESGGDPISLGVNGVIIGVYSAGGRTEILIDAANFTLQQDYQFTLTGAPVFFKLYYLEMEYTDRPVPTTRMRIPPDNAGTSGKKRMFTCPPFVIDTLGNTVTYQAELDGILSPVADPTFITREKTTINPQFSVETLATDVGALLTGGPFEFYGVFTTDWIVEKIPSGTLVDQTGPYEALRLAFLERFRYRCIAEGTQINYQVFVEDVISYSGTFATLPNVDKTYEVVLPKGLNGTTFRIVYTSTAQIHRYSSKIKLRITGGQADGKWVGK